MRLFLICHGIALFWYRFEKARHSLDYDGYTLLLPRRDPKAPEHVVRLGLGAGAPIQILNEYTETPGTREFVLDFGYEKAKRDRKKKDKEQYLLMYRNTKKALKADPDIKDRGNPGVSFAIDIPYPTSEKALRATTYKKPPYQVKGDGQKDFEITTRRVVDTTAFIFDNIDPAYPIQLREVPSGSKIEVLPAGFRDDVKLHLYSQPKVHVDGHSDHLFLLNNMLNYKGKKFDLKLEKARDSDFEEILRIPGLTDADRSDLAPPREVNAEKAVIDPAECGQGGGC